MQTKIDRKRARLIKKLEKNYQLMNKYFGGSQKTGNIKFTLRMIIRDIRELPDSKFRG